MKGKGKLFVSVGEGDGGRVSGEDCFESGEDWPCQFSPRSVLGAST